jgi:hypothetical protein
MAGFISISENKGISMGTLGFNYITERIRHCFKQNETSIRDKIFTPLDHEGMSLIELDTQGIEGFNVFFRATESAYRKAKNEDPDNIPEATWQELIQNLKTDPRWKPQHN